MGGLSRLFEAWKNDPALSSSPSTLKSDRFRHARNLWWPVWSRNGVRDVRCIDAPANRLPMCSLVCHAVPLGRAVEGGELYVLI